MRQLITNEVSILVGGGRGEGLLAQRQQEGCWKWSVFWSGWWITAVDICGNSSSCTPKIGALYTFYTCIFMSIFKTTGIGYRKKMWRRKWLPFGKPWARQAHYQWVNTTRKLSACTRPCHFSVALNLRNAPSLELKFASFSGLGSHTYFLSSLSQSEKTRPNISRASCEMILWNHAAYPPSRSLWCLCQYLQGDTDRGDP